MEQKPLHLSLAAVRTMHLAAQGLLTPPERPVAKADVRAAIRRMGLLQIDTISVVARSPYLVLWSRLGAYEPRWLDELLAEGALFEYWSHAACFLPIEDFPIYRRRMLDFAANHRWKPEEEAVQRVRERVAAQGAVRSVEFVQPEQRRGTWWDWKPEKVALEHLFFAGELMIARREGFQRVYARRETVLPDWDDSRTLSEEEGRRAMILKAAHALGVVKARWLPLYFPDYLRFRNAKQILPVLLETLANESALVRVEIADWNEPAYVPADFFPLAEQAAEGALQASVTTLLSPFDPVVSDRDRAEELFGFAYRIETYTPAEKRRYGYFSLPILHCDQLIGRLDAKAHRKAGQFEIKSLHLEPDVVVTDTLRNALREMLQTCAHWHKTPEVLCANPEHAALLDSVPV